MLSSAFLLLEVLAVLVVSEALVSEALVLEAVLLQALVLVSEVLVPVLEVLEDTDQDLLAVDLPSILTSMLEVLEAVAALVPEVLEVPVALELVDSCSTES